MEGGVDEVPVGMAYRRDFYRVFDGGTKVQGTIPRKDDSRPEDRVDHQT